MFKSVKVSPITTVEQEEAAVKLFNDTIQSICKHLRIDNVLYLEPDSADLIDNMLSLDRDPWILANQLQIEGYASGLNALKPKNLLADPASTVKAPEPQAAKRPEPVPTKAFGSDTAMRVPQERERQWDKPKGREEDKAIVDEAKEEKEEEESLEKSVMKTLQSTTFNPRAEAPEEFFLFYSDTMAWVPLFLLYLLILILVNVVGPFFA